MRILAIQPFLGGYRIGPNAGGGDKAALRLAHHLAQAGHETYVLPWRKERILNTRRFALADDGSSATVLQTVHMPSNRACVKELISYCCKWTFRRSRLKNFGDLLLDMGRDGEVTLRRAMETARPDLVHVHQLHRGLAELYRDLDFKVPLIATHHSPRLFVALSSYDWVVFVSRLQRDEAIRREPSIAEKSQVIYYAVDAEYRIPITPKETGGVLYLGNLSKRKGLDILVRAYAADAELNRYPLTVVGDGELRQSCERTAQERGLSVRFTGRLSHEANAALMAQSSFFVMPSEAEGLAMVYLEALCMGLPIIGFPPNVSELEELLGMKVGLPFDPPKEDPLRLAALIKEIMSPRSGFDLAHRAEMMRRARERFSSDRFYAEYYAFYETILPSGAAGGGGDGRGEVTRRPS
ncbi:MAG: glycosyltransferase family 4 protein [Candidatus Brocadiia bacterium]|nr:glycosyltransferase family 4 protein [Candidatus Brocadiia bacterium]